MVSPLRETICLQAIQRARGMSQPLESYLIKPVQRMTKYTLLVAVSEQWSVHIEKRLAGSALVL